MGIYLNALDVGIKQKLPYITFKSEINNDKIQINASLKIKEYDDDIFIKIVAFESGTLHCFAVFDQIERTLEVFKLINDFNEDNPWFRAYVSRIKEKDFLEIHYVVINLPDTQSAVYNVNSFFNYLADENIAKGLKPLTKITH